MTPPEKKEIRTLAIIICCLIFTAICGFIAGHRSNNTEIENKIQIEVAKQKTIDSIETFNYATLVDSLTLENKVLTKAYNSISQFKQKTITEINANNKKISNLTDGNVQHYVDSLRNSSGLN